MAPHRTPLEEVTLTERELLEVCLTILRRDRGTYTPSETFIYTQLIAYGVHGKLTVQMTRRDLEQFDEDLSDAIETARLLVKQYPELLQTPAA
jgi:hypothetical protein